MVLKIVSSPLGTYWSIQIQKYLTWKSKYDNILINGANDKKIVTYLDNSFNCR